MIGLYDTIERRRGLYERAAAVSGDERPWSSEASGTGWRGVNAASGWQKLLKLFSWGLVIVALLFSAFSMWSLYGKASRIGGAYAVFSGRDRLRAARFDAALEATCKEAGTADGVLCKGDVQTILADKNHPSACLGDAGTLETSKELPAPAAKISPPTVDPLFVSKLFGDGEKRYIYVPKPACLAAWDQVLSFADSAVADAAPRKLAAAPPERLSLDSELFGMFAAIMAFGAAAGLVGNGRFFGLWINAQNRFSLSTMQVSLWTALILAPFATITVFQFVLLPEAAREGLNLSFAPAIPGLLYALMGITFATTFLSKYILWAKEGPTTIQAGDVARAVPLIATSASGLAQNDDSGQASLKDLFVGEENVNSAQVDVSRFQNVVITLTLVASYGLAVFAVLDSVDTAALLGALHARQSVFPTLPAVTGSFLALLLTSHAGYLIAKASSK